MSSDPLPPSFVPGRRWKIGAHVALSIGLVLASMVMLNYLSARHFRQFRWTADPRFQLSPATTEVLHAVTNRVKVIVFFDRTKPLYDLVADLFTQYQLRCPRLDIEYIDYVRSPGRAHQAALEYGLASAEEGDRIVFEAGGRTKVVYAKDLSEFDYDALLRGEKEVKRTGFKGEQLFTSALYGVLNPRPTKVYFLKGHEEHDPADKDDQMGYSQFARALEESQISVASLEPDALLTGDVPADCNLLIIANPLRALARKELERIDGYLNQGGRLFALLGINSVNQVTGLEELLQKWGVQVGRNFVYERPQGKAGDPSSVVVTHFANHPIVNPLARSRLQLITPRSVGARAQSPQGADAPKVAELATTSLDGVASLGQGRFERQGEAIPLMVAVEKGAIQGISADRGATRMVIVGESYFLANKPIESNANRDFARNAVNWLLNRDLLVQGIGSQPIREYRVTITTAELATVRWLLLAGFPGGVMFIGLLVWLRRRV